MGWASGSELAEELWDELKKYIPKKNHKTVAKLLVDSFEEHDADDWDTSSDDSLYMVAYPEMIENDD